MVNMKSSFVTSMLLMLAGVAAAFTTTTVAPQQQVSTSTSLSMAEPTENDLLRWARSKRSADSDDNVVELMRPLGVVLNQDETGNVYVETLAPKGNAARTGKVRRRTHCRRDQCVKTNGYKREDAEAPRAVLWPSLRYKKANYLPLPYLSVISNICRFPNNPN